MTRCGRCGLFLKYPNDEQNDGICLWHDLLVPREEAYEHRECPDFMNWIKDMPITDQLRIKVEKAKLHDNYRLIQQSRFASLCSLVISLIALAISIATDFYR